MMIKKISILLFGAMTASMAIAKDLRTVVFKVEQMHCEMCEAKVKRNLPFEKGVKNLKTNVPTRNVVVTYDADKTTVEKLKAGFEKIGYKAEIVKTEQSEKQQPKQP